MQMIRVTGTVDEQHRLWAQVPPTVAPGPIEVELLIPSDEDEAGKSWERGIAREWTAELSDPREDIYSLSDGEPVDGSR